MPSPPSRSGCLLSEVMAQLGVKAEGAQPRPVAQAGMGFDQAFDAGFDVGFDAGFGGRPMPGTSDPSRGGIESQSGYAIGLLAGYQAGQIAAGEGEELLLDLAGDAG